MSTHKSKFSRFQPNIYTPKGFVLLNKMIRYAVTKIVSVDTGTSFLDKKLQINICLGKHVNIFEYSVHA